MKSVSNFLAQTAIIFITLFVLTSCSDLSIYTDDSSVAVTGISLNNTKIQIEVGDTEQLTAIVTPDNASSKNVKWNSSNEAVATVSASGAVIAVGSGTVVITATAGSNFIADCEVKVDDNYGLADTTGDNLLIHVDTTSFNIIYANNSDSIVNFQTGVNDNSGIVNITRKFFIGETEVTNALMVVVLQWAYDNGKLSDTVADPNGLDATIVKYNNQPLLVLDDADSKINYNGSALFSVDAGFENHPVINITWFGAVMFCNWLTEMKDGNTDNVVYTWVDDGAGDGIAADSIWQDDETVADDSKGGYRLPTADEWSYAARYIDGIDWTYGDHVSGDETGYSFDDGTPLGGDPISTVFGDYTWNSDNSNPGDGPELKAVAGKTANHLGLYDVSGNAWEWNFTASTTSRVLRGGCFMNSGYYLRIGFRPSTQADDQSNTRGFRFVKTR